MSCCQFPGQPSDGNGTRSSIVTYAVWDYEMKIPNSLFTLKGHSRGSEKTGFFIPQLKLMFDAGITTPYDPQMVLITHCHLDHSQALPMILASAAVSTRPSPIVCCPRPSLKLFEEFVHAAYKLNYNISSGTQKQFVGVDHGDVIPLEKTGFFVKVYRLVHSVPSVGYGLFEDRCKLKPEFTSLSGKEITQLRAQHIEVMDSVPKPIMAFVCDTGIDAFKQSPELLSFPFIVVECTFFEEELLELAHQSQHIHWKDLRPIIESHPKITFILIHFSMRYADLNVLQHYIDGIPNVNLWMN
jgi:ribonuclease Z